MAIQFESKEFRGGDTLYASDMNEIESGIVQLIEAVNNMSTSGTGTAGRGIQSIVLTSGNHSPGTMDTYTLTYTDNTTFEFQIYNGRDGANGADGEGSGTVTWETISGVPSEFPPAAHEHSEYAPAYTYGTDELTVGTSTLESGKLYFVYTES